MRWSVKVPNPAGNCPFVSSEYIYNPSLYNQMLRVPLKMDYLRFDRMYYIKQIMSRERSRAYIIRLELYSRYELSNVKHWVSGRCLKWYLREFVFEGVPIVESYVRFTNPIAASSLRELNIRLIVKATKLSIEDYTKEYMTGNNSYHSPMLSTMSNSANAISSWETELLKSLKMTTPTGMVNWIVYEDNVGFSKCLKFIRSLSSRPDVILTNRGSIDQVCIPLKESLSSKTKSIVLFPNMDGLTGEYYDLIDEMRHGFVMNDKVSSQPLSTSPLNILIFSKQLPDQQYAFINVLTI